MATLPVMRTWTDGEIVDDSIMNAQIRDMVNFLLSNKPYAQLTKVGSSTQAAATGVWTPCTFGAEQFDNDAGHSNTVNPERYTVVTAGKYLVSGLISFTANNTGNRGAKITKNGAEVGPVNIMQTALTNVCGVPCPSMIVDCSIGDYLQIEGFQTSGISLNMLGSVPSEGCHMTVLWIGP